jgi:hypothetical protein
LSSLSRFLFCCLFIFCLCLIGYKLIFEIPSPWTWEFPDDLSNLFCLEIFGGSLRIDLWKSWSWNGKIHFSLSIKLGGIAPQILGQFG